MYLTFQLSIVNMKLFLSNQSKWLAFKKYVIIEYSYIYWFLDLTFLQKKFHVMYYIFGIINPSRIMTPKRGLTHL